MARRVVARGPFRTGARRSVVWSGQDTVGTLAFGTVTRTTAGVSIYPNGLEALEKFTITRILADLTIKYTAANAVGGEVVAYTGIIIVSVEAFTAGAASVPDPRTRQSDDWMYLGMHALTATSTTLDTSGLSTLRVPLDLRGQRKTSPGEAIIGVFALDGVSGSTRTIISRLNFRNLLKLT